MNHMIVRFRKNGFTLIELIVVIALIGILSSIIVISYSRHIEESRIAVDQQTLLTLNHATRYYETQDPSPNPFKIATNNDNTLMQVLVDSKYLPNKVKTLQKNTSFQWNFDKDVWILVNTSILTYDQVVMAISGGFKGNITGSYTGTAHDIMIPNTLNGVTVSAIYQDVFNGKNLTSVSFETGSSINRIHARAFKNNNLTEIVLPNTIKKLDYGAFLDNNIVKITIGSNVEFEGKVFQNNDKFKDTYIAQGSKAGTYLYVNGAWVKQ